MLIQFAAALILVVVSVALHAGALAWLTHRTLPRLPLLHAGLRGMVRTLAGAFLLMMASHLCQAALWAALYRAVGAFPDAESALYFSLTCYSTLGFGDLVGPQSWRLLGPIEAVTGILMFGWSTGYLFAYFTRLYAAVEGRVQ